MNENEKLIGMIAGLEFAITHLTHVLIVQAKLDKQAVAASFEGSAKLMAKQSPHDTEMISLVMKQIANSIREMEPPTLRLIPRPPAD